MTVETSTLQNLRNAFAASDMGHRGVSAKNCIRMIGGSIHLSKCFDRACSVRFKVTEPVRPARKLPVALDSRDPFWYLVHAYCIMILSLPLDLFEELNVTDNNSWFHAPTQQPKRFHLNFVISFSGDNKHIFRGRKNEFSDQPHVWTRR